MKVVPIAAEERERMRALSAYQILDTPREPDYDFITSLAARICQTPVSLLSILDANRQWFKSAFGVSIVETSLSNNISSRAINNPEKLLVIEDLSSDEQFGKNPILLNEQTVLFYAGVAIVNSEGHVLGFLCVADFKPNTLSEENKKLLIGLSKQAGALLELRKKTLLLKQSEETIKMAYADLESISRIASHDLKSPLNNIISLAQLIKEELGDAIGKDGADYINFINEAAYYLSDLVSSIHSYSKASRLPTNVRERVDTAFFVSEIISYLKVPENIKIELAINAEELYIPADAMRKIIFHLLNNAIQYNDKINGNIKITVREDLTNYYFEVSDNGEGVNTADHEKIFELFRRMNDREKNGENMGIGLAIARRLIEKMQGKITVQSEPGLGATFSFFVPKLGG